MCPWPNGSRAAAVCKQECPCPARDKRALKVLATSALLVSCDIAYTLHRGLALLRGLAILMADTRKKNFILELSGTIFVSVNMLWLNYVAIPNQASLALRTALGAYWPVAFTEQSW